MTRLGAGRLSLGFLLIARKVPPRAGKAAFVLFLRIRPVWRSQFEMRLERFFPRFLPHFFPNAALAWRAETHSCALIRTCRRFAGDWNLDTPLSA